MSREFSTGITIEWFCLGMNDIWCSQRPEQDQDQYYRKFLWASTNNVLQWRQFQDLSGHQWFSAGRWQPCHCKHFSLTASQDSPGCSSHPLPHMPRAHLHLSDPLAQRKAVRVPVKFPQTTQMYFLSLSSCARYSKFPPSLVALCWGLSSLSASHAGLTQLDTGHRHVAGPRPACCSLGSSGSLVQAACLQLVVEGLDFTCPCGSFWGSSSPLWACWAFPPPY